MRLFEQAPSWWAGLALCGFVATQTAIGLAAGWRSRHQRKRNGTARKRAFIEQTATLARTTRAAQSKFAAWDDTRPMRIAALADEAHHVRSFYLTPLDGKPLPPYEPGQYLTLHLPVGGSDRPLVRCYSLSDRPREDYYRLTVKRASRPNATHHSASIHLHEALQVGDSFDVAAPRGQFFLRPERETPIVLVAGGIGITPLLAMLNTMAHRGFSQEVYLFLGMRNGREHPFKEHIERLALQHPQLRLLVSYSKPTPADEPYRDFQHVGRVTIDHLREVLPTNRYDFYLCGPGEMMQDLVAGLEAWGVPQERIHFEAFGPATVRRTAPSNLAGVIGSAVRFAHSKKERNWNADTTSLLELGEAAGVALASGCRAGNCGECLVRVADGNIKTLREPGFPVPAEHCLTCISVPVGPLTLDA
jgi:ferredoxin-NADP reductase